MRSAATVLCLAFTVACTGDPSASATWAVQRAAEPARTLVSDGSGAWLATFTDGASTVTLAGPMRTFDEDGAAAAVTHGIWVRLLPAPFAGTVDMAWLEAALADDSPDVLAVAMEYLPGAPPLLSGGLQIAGDASYGPLVDGERVEGADFHDYLGIAWDFDTGRVEPDPAQRGSLDCSGYLRMVFGYRGGLALTRAPAADHHAIPRRSFEIYDAAPGVVLVPDTGAPVARTGALAPGDLLFWDAATDDGTRLDHSGLYLGVDADGHPRFLSSRKTADGPTMGDRGGRAILDGTTELYSRTFRAARRL